MGKPTSGARNSEAVRNGGLWFLASKEVSFPESIGVKKRTQGTEISKYLEERTSTETPLVVTSERGPGQWRMQIYRNRLEWRASWVTAPYEVDERSSLSKAGHVKSCLNMGGPPSKPKYSSATDSEQVP